MPKRLRLAGEEDGAGAKVLIVRAYPPAAMGRADAADYCGFSLSEWDRWTAAGKNPEPTMRGKCPMWGQRALQAWVDMGYPDRATFVKKLNAAG